LRDDDEAEEAEEGDGSGSISLVVVAIISLSFSNRDVLKACVLNAQKKCRFREKFPHLRLSHV